ncbi:hypothetical protein [Desulfosporosinus meridiei]|uniref:Uncharacterized protein n=1 Tax=Desulfosporosinus meridiei (strain ATCC BAA-275 / DSM 13257 / KCTC 12902 / NCIMB 13706 / S10) TaxID=768704 RepID=J7J203_DESMD|nr:hypothetical protein [Desulfosporosinus meridiei]AFQ45001.1 hypothetical protein Desmer_3119 [Desulfosporosinus meridiei DSM 13257]
MTWNIREWNWSDSVVTISTAIFALVSLISVYISVTTWQTQREAARPYLTFIESPSLNFSENSGFEFEFKFKNVGTHPATNLSSRTLIFEQQLQQKPIFIDDYTVVNDIPRDATTSLLLNPKVNSFTKELEEINPHFIIISLKYSDPIVHKSYSQTIYLKWAGVINNKQQPIIHVEMSEKSNIEHYLKIHQLLD